MNATSKVRDYLDASAAKLRGWQDQHLSVEAARPVEAEKPGPRLVTSFPRAPYERRGLVLGRGLGGARRS